VDIEGLNYLPGVLPLRFLLITFWGVFRCSTGWVFFSQVGFYRLSSQGFRETFLGFFSGRFLGSIRPRAFPSPCLQGCPPFSDTPFSPDIFVFGAVVFPLPFLPGPPPVFFSRGSLCVHVDVTPSSTDIIPAEQGSSRCKIPDSRRSPSSSPFPPGPYLRALLFFLSLFRSGPSILA